jgi:hypothetical protein
VEKSSLVQESGFAITVGTNGSKVLESLGFDFDRACSVDCNYVGERTIFKAIYINHIIF